MGKLSTRLWTLTVIGAGALACWAQSEGETPAVREGGSKIFDHFVVSGGWIAYCIIALSFVAVALMVEHFITIRRKTIVAPLSAEQLRDLIERKKYIDAIHFSADDPTMLSYVVNAGLLEAANGYASMQRAMEAALEERSSRLFRKIEYLSIIGNVSPMIGLFGTVYAMILMFGSIGEEGRIPEADIVAAQISIALVATFWGLLVAVPSLAAFGWFRNRIDVLAAECALSCDRLTAVFRPGTAPAPAAPSGLPPRREPASPAPVSMQS